MARDIILNLAISLDGFICDEDGGFAWISGQGDVRADTADHFDFDGFLASCDTIVMGRKAYEDCLSSLPEAAEKRFLVASRTPRAPEGRVVFLSADVVAEVLALKDRPGKHIWLFGGGERAGGCFRRGFRRWNSTWTAARSQTASLFWSTAGGAGKADRQQPQGAFPAAVVL